ncbi:MAG: ATP synthase subunit I [Lentisphaerota bacterium]
MNEVAFIILSAICGLILGLFFFGGLWWTIKTSITSKHPALLMLSSLIIRICVVLVGFYYVSQGSWKRILGCLTGFIAAKFIVTRFTKPESEKSNNNSNEADNAHKP